MSRGHSAADLSSCSTISVPLHSRHEKPPGRCCGGQGVGQDIGTSRALGLFLFCLPVGRRAEMLVTCNPIAEEVTLHGVGILSTGSTAGILLPFANFAYCLLSS